MYKYSFKCIKKWEIEEILKFEIFRVFKFNFEIFFIIDIKRYMLRKAEYKEGC